MKIGNVYNYDLELPSFFEKVNDLKSDEMTLIVGWRNAKQLYPEMSILNWK